MDASEEFKAQQQTIHTALLAVNRAVNRITSEDLTFLRAVHPPVASQLDEQSARLLRLTNGLLRSAAGATGRSQPPPVLEDAEDVGLHWQGVVDVIDALLEKADTTLDEYTGLLKRKDAPTAGAAEPDSKKPKSTTNDRLDWSIRRANIAKPQDQFERPPDNSATEPWKPLLTRKPHAIVPLADSLQTFVDQNEHVQYKHPYETEITQMRYPESVYEKREPIRYLPTETTAAVWVDTFEGVQAMLAELRKADLIAVDLEHHDYRTYTGLLSLMQVSTRTKDWVVDTLQPWRHKLEILNEVFADPAKIKVFHGASSDIVWLQRDLGLYVVGLFDTYFACDCLDYPARSLAYLLKKFVGFDADKKYQMADWRIRPLPEEMLFYARSDTHFLLYIFDMVRNELADKSDRSDPEKDLTEYVLQKSKEVSLSRHEALLCDPETGQGARGWFNNLAKSYAMLSGEQFAVYKALFHWRDELARRLDESPGFIMPIRVLSDIARILPPDRKALWSLLTTTARVTKSSLEEIFTLIQEARARGVNGPTSLDFLRSETAAGALAKTAYGKRLASSATAAPPTAETPSEPIPLPDITELRSNFSQLWGQIPVNSKKWKEDLAGSEQIEAPWFSFAQAAITSSGPQQAPATAAVSRMPESEDFIALLPPSAVTPQTPKLKDESGEAKKTSLQADVTIKPSQEDEDDKGGDGDGDDEPFTLKWGKKAGKPQPDAAATKKQKKDKKEKKEKKEKKKDKKDKKATHSKSAKSSEQDEDENEETAETTQTSDSDGGAPINDEAGEFVPFDYDTAGSLTQPKKQDKKAPYPKKKVFNPYGGKGDDGPKAARRMHFEKTGKTATFKK